MLILDIPSNRHNKLLTINFAFALIFLATNVKEALSFWIGIDEHSIAVHFKFLDIWFFLYDYQPFFITLDNRIKSQLKQQKSKNE